MFKPLSWVFLSLLVSKVIYFSEWIFGVFWLEGRSGSEEEKETLREKKNL